VKSTAASRTFCHGFFAGNQENRHDGPFGWLQFGLANRGEEALANALPLICPQYNCTCEAGLN
jgi:hypothetical protein